MKNINSKLLVLLLKYAPVVYSAGIFVGTLLATLEIYLYPISILVGSSLFSNIIAHIANRTFHYCKWHLILIYYVYMFISIITIDYLIPDIDIYLGYADALTIISLIVFVISYFNRNKK